MTKTISLYDEQSRRRSRLEGWARGMLFISATISIAVTLLIVASVFFESLRFFEKIPLHEFLFGTHWSPQMALRSDQGGSTGAFGVIPVFVGTLLITCIAMMIAVPLALYAAIYLSEYASATMRSRIKPLLEILAGVPTVVYGYFAVIAVAPFFRQSSEALTEYIRELSTKPGLTFLEGFSVQVSSESALSAGLVMGVMIVPFILSLSDDVMHAVPRALREGSLALGATRAETIKKVIIPAAFPGIMSAVLLGVSRAMGETMIVVMAAGLTAQMTLNPLASVTTVTVQIVTLLTGDQEFESAKTLAAFALGLLLLLVTLVLNILALAVVKRYKEQYE